ncbi:hypothetical protein MSAN_02353400 [Mycena sanguinolenta]|uniref:Uncharacterized protein n=1 Tax=Mycena sanguinolenta TaxID=230812 RepID=A0A8H7CG74_9AGAR|nr:hypothetical protein MSAN_02353400 [Mycena sanguinolenta]
MLPISNAHRTSSGILEDSIKRVEEMLELAKARCARSYPKLMYIAHDFLELESSVSGIKYQLLEANHVSTWNEFKKYLENSKEMWRNIRRYEKELKEIQTSILRINEAERQHELSGKIQTSHEIISSLTPGSAMNRRLRSSARVYEPMV